MIRYSAHLDKNNQVLCIRHMQTAYGSRLRPICGFVFIFLCGLTLRLYRLILSDAACYDSIGESNL